MNKGKTGKVELRPCKKPRCATLAAHHEHTGTCLVCGSTSTPWKSKHPGSACLNSWKQLAGLLPASGMSTSRQHQYKQGNTSCNHFPKWFPRTGQIDWYVENATFQGWIPPVWLRGHALRSLVGVWDRRLSPSRMYHAAGHQVTAGHVVHSSHFLMFFHTSSANTGWGCRPPHPPWRGRLTMHWRFAALFLLRVGRCATLL